MRIVDAGKYLVGIVVSGIFVYFTIRGVSLNNILEGLKDSKYFYLLPTAVLFLSISVLRSLRWGIILSPIKQINQVELFPISCVGFMAIVIFPMRVGELVRPYLLSTNMLVPFSSSLGTIFVERALDIFSILTIFFITFLSSSLPLWLVRSGYVAFVAFIALIVFIFFLYMKTESVLKLISPLIKRLPDRFKGIIMGLIYNFIDGFKIIARPAKLLSTITLSVLIWVLSGLAIYSMFYFYGFKLSLLSAFVVLVINIIGISLPTGPGMLGNFQFSCIVALALFDITKEHAFGFSMAYYVFGIGIIILLGLMSLPFVKVSFKEVFKNIKSVKPS